ncbi:MAG: winged helix-turn-helix transcriptional regulator [Candidatus Diapherotrites archaeon]|nr:winged helix-turn-helix transcriptional regulator [Candidatus Diapherotrites archaeon]
MGFLSWLLKKKRSEEKKNEEEPLKHRKEEEIQVNKKKELISGIKEQTIALESLNAPEQRVYSPAVEHPLLTIQDRISKLEELYRSINEKLDVIGEDMAKKHDLEDIKALINEDIVKEDRILSGIVDINDRIRELEERKAELTRQIDNTTRQLTQDITELTHVEQTIELLEADKKILDALAKEELSTLELVDRVGYTRQYIWERLKALQEAGYVRSIKKGRRTKYQIIAM